jgi:hypothetical protein
LLDSRQNTMAPAKPSVQNQYVLDAMGEAAEETSATLARLQSSLDLLRGVVAGVDTAQQQMRRS